MASQQLAGRRRLIQPITAITGVRSLSCRMPRTNPSMPGDRTCAAKKTSVLLMGCPVEF